MNSETNPGFSNPETNPGFSNPETNPEISTAIERNDPSNGEKQPKAGQKRPLPPLIPIRDTKKPFISDGEKQSKAGQKRSLPPLIPIQATKKPFKLVHSGYSFGLPELWKNDQQPPPRDVLIRSLKSKITREVSTQSSIPIQPTPSTSTAQQISSGTPLVISSTKIAPLPSQIQHTCKHCYLSFTHKRNLAQHRCTLLANRKKRVVNPKKKIKMNRIFKTITQDIPHRGDAPSFLAIIKRGVRSYIRKEMKLKGQLKCKLSINVDFYRPHADETQYLSTWFSSKMTTVLTMNDFASFWKEARDKIMESIETFIHRGSGWIHDKVETYQLKIAKYEPLYASSYIPTPEELVKKRAILNVQNTRDQKCFLWAVLSALHPTNDNNPQRLQHYKDYENELDMSGVFYPVSTKAIDKFEKNNKIAINVFGYEDKKVVPLRLTKIENAEIINLLILSNSFTNHYCWIKNLDALCYNLTKHKAKCFMCYYCLHRFSSERTLSEHKVLCTKLKPQRVELPKPGNNILKFEKFGFKYRVPYVIYADFETYNVPTNPTDEKNTTLLFKHKLSSFSYVILDVYGNVLKHCSYLDRENVGNVAECFLRCLKDESVMFKEHFSRNLPLKMTPQDEFQFKNATVCHICEEALDNDDRVRDHCHATGVFRGAAHNKCNLNLIEDNKFVPIFFHNFAYDGKLLLPAFGLPDLEEENISCIPKSLEKYITITWGVYRFLDSFQFLPTSLENLVNNLEAYPITASQFPQNHPLLSRKGIFPYEYLSENSKFAETHLPPKEAFFSTLTQEGVSDADYQHAQNVWDTFKIKDLGEYQLLYNLSDVLLLADVFESFRKLSMKFYEIDPCHCVTAPGLSWQACLKKTKVKIELLTDIDQHLFFESAIRGGVSTIMHREAKANNPYLPDFNPEKPNSYIMYYDCNGLYATAMHNSYMGTGNFRFLEGVEFQNFDVMKIADDSDTGYFIECDIEYPSSLHDLHNCYPLAPEHMKIEKSMLSPYSLELLNDLKITTSNVPKLVPNLRNKTKYILHYRALKFYKEMGLKDTKTYRILAFDQSPWMRPYIEFNTAQRMKATNNFEKDFFKLLINSLYGKTMENLRNREIVEFVQDGKIALKRIASPSFKDYHLINDGLTLVRMEKSSVFLNRPIFIGATILDDSKILMYDFHYNHVKPTYGDSAKLLFTDTDSLTYHIYTDDVYKDMGKSIELFDTSDYPKNHFLHSNTNKKVLGKFKDELNGEPISEFIGLRAKMYSFFCGNHSSKKTGKGIARVVLRKQITHQDYRDALYNKKSFKADMHFIRNHNHEMGLIKQTKTTLSPYDDKRWIHDDGSATFAHFHCKIPIPMVEDDDINDVDGE